MLDVDISDEIRSIAFDASGSLVALAHGTIVTVLQVSTSHVYETLQGHLANVTICSFHPAQPCIAATASEDRTFRVHDDRPLMDLLH